MFLKNKKVKSSLVFILLLALILPLCPSVLRVHANNYNAGDSKQIESSRFINTQKNCRILSSNYDGKVLSGRNKNNKQGLDKPQETPPLPFVDVDKTNGSYPSVEWAYNNGIMNGTSSNTFSLDAFLTRAMLVTVLYRMDKNKEDLNYYEISFKDVPKNSYYYNPVKWANKNGIVTGYTNLIFGSEDKLSVEQMYTILYRYAKYKKINVSKYQNTKLNYKDLSEISPYAIDAMKFAVATELSTNKDYLHPKKDSTRQYVVLLLHLFSLQTNQF